jgi:GWxTD domain-containing protein
MLSDSTLIISPGQKLRLSMKGLYLFQKDTLATEGVAVRVEDDYPKFSKISSLVGPMVYICTKQEYDRLVLAREDKKTFDRIVLTITNDTDRARKLMRNYFRRVELANLYFTSYKEGWKTDRGMIFIVFGLPDQVYKFNDREVWTYENDYYKATFNFVKSPSLFDPDNYVLIREKKSQQSWYEVIDLWRNARF